MGKMALPRLRGGGTRFQAAMAKHKSRRAMTPVPVTIVKSVKTGETDQYIPKSHDPRKDE